MDHKIVFNKIEKALNASPYDALIITGVDNLLYFSGTSLQNLYSQKNQPIYLFWKKGSQPICICPVIWESTLREISSIMHFYPYSLSADNHQAVINNLVNLINQETAPGSTIGIDMERIDSATFRILKDWVGNRRFSPADSWIKTLRMVKTSEEVDLLKTIAARTEHGISGSSHHLSTLGGKTEKFQSEDVRVHCMEREMDTTGYHCLSLVASGEHAKKMWPIAPRFGLGRNKNINAGDIVRIEMQAVLDGYWSNLAKILIKGDYTPALKDKYQQLVQIRDFVVKSLKPGITCSQAAVAVAAEAKRQDVVLLEGTPIGHSIGVTPREAPYLVDGDDTVITKDMWFAIDIGMRLETGEIFRLKDMVWVKEDGAEIIGWYQNWNHPYITAYTF